MDPDCSARFVPEPPGSLPEHLCSGQWADSNSRRNVVALFSVYLRQELAVPLSGA
jgi:hypothetical protein